MCVCLSVCLFTSELHAIIEQRTSTAYLVIKAHCFELNSVFFKIKFLEKEIIAIGLHTNLQSISHKLQIVHARVRVLVHSSSTVQLCVYSVELVFRLLLPSHVVTVFCDVHVDS